MNKHIFSYLVLGGAALLVGACNDSESDLLKPKVYFESRENMLSMEDEAESITFDLTSRLSTMTSSQVDVSYAIADPSVVDEYNARYGTAYEMLDVSHIKLSSTTSSIPSGKLYADNVKLELSNLETVEEGKTFVVPVRVQSASVPTLPGTSIAYFFLSKPIKITKVGTFNSNYISIRFPAGTYFSSFTYETLIYINRLLNNNTIMGTEGIMLLRIGDAPGTPKDYLEIAGQQHYNATEGMKTGRWYHVALTYDQPSGRTVMYVNGTKWAESAWGIPGFDPNADVGFNIGMIPNFPWGTRPLYGYLSETRVWSVARTENQLKQNMLGVDPKSDGLALYYKLDGSETQEGGSIIDAAKGIGGTTNGIAIKTLDTPVAIN
ncbi:DUF1735 and LamG domain-containing protein [Bacteroides reticulotermitis]|uniref:DUF1735 and LamG domain-containing protein n=1 Tax=Bacteroides reticulotermitis TaxID=1133319 RepID=UPI003A89C186